MSNQDPQGEYIEITQVIDEEADKIMIRDNVVGVAIGHKIRKYRDTGELCITVFVEQKFDPALLPSGSVIPKSIKKYKTDVVETGTFFASSSSEEVSNSNQIPRRYQRAQTEAKYVKDRIRPAQGGYSVGHQRVTAGTIATVVYDYRPFPGIPRRHYILSTNHILANSNDSRTGDPILQPGPVDGGTLPDDLIGRLSRSVPIGFDGRSNFVDAAIAEGEFYNLDRQIYWIGYLRGGSRPQIGQIVQKTGKSTGYTTGRITQLHAKVNVNHFRGLVAKMTNQIRKPPSREL